MKRSTPPPKKQLQALRRRIDVVDAELLRLVNRRASLVAEVGGLKRRHELNVFDRSREEFILKRLARMNSAQGGILPGETIQRIWKFLIEQYRSFEQDEILKEGNRAQGRERTVSIIGLGLMGGSLALALREYAPGIRRIGFDPRNRIPQGMVSRQALTPKEALQADIVILAMPVGGIKAFLRKHRRDFRPGSLVIDLGSTKAEICAEARRLPPSVRFVGGHPLAGKAVSGAQNAEPGLFKNRPFVLVPGEREDPKSLAEAMQLVAMIGAMPVLLSAEQHDRVLALTSHLPQVASVALALAVSKSVAKEELVYGPAFLDLTRLALSSFEMWRDVARSNGDDMTRAIDEYVETLLEIKSTILKAAFRKQFAAARKFREKLV